jgi:hypothetical protein
MPVNNGLYTADQIQSKLYEIIKKFTNRDLTNFNFSIMVAGNKPEE